MATKEALVRAKQNYRKKTKQVAIEFTESEMDLYEFLKSQTNKSGFVKNLIRKAKEEQ